MSEKSRLLRLYVADERRLILEKSALEVMLTNVQNLRNKLKVEQVQLSSFVQTEMGQDASQLLDRESTSETHGQDLLENNTEFEFDPSNQPVLDLNVDSAGGKFFFKGKEQEEEEEDEEDVEDEEDDVMCAMDVLGAQTEHDVDFGDF